MVQLKSCWILCYLLWQKVNRCCTMRYRWGKWCLTLANALSRYNVKFPPAYSRPPNQKESSAFNHDMTRNGRVRIIWGELRVFSLAQVLPKKMEALLQPTTRGLLWCFGLKHGLCFRVEATVYEKPTHSSPSKPYAAAQHASPKNSTRTTCAVIGRLLVHHFRYVAFPVSPSC